MRCLVCRQIIKSGEHVLYGAAAICSGTGEFDFDHISSQNDFEGAIHLSCLESPVVTTRTPNTETHEVVVEESDSIITRSNALDLLEI